MCAGILEHGSISLQSQFYGTSLLSYNKCYDLWAAARTYSMGRTGGEYLQGTGNGLEDRVQQRL